MTILTKDYYIFYVFSKLAKDKHFDITKNVY